MKKLVVLMMVMAMGVSIMACGNNNEGNTESSVVESTQESEITVLPGEPSEVVTNLRNAVAEAIGENYFPQMAIPAEFYDSYGITSDMYDAIYGEMPMISTNVDTLIIADATEGQLENLEAAMAAYKKTLEEDTMQYPMNLGKIQASQVFTIGEYVCFIQLGGDVMTAMEKGDEEVIKHCQAENAKAVAAIEALFNEQ